MGDGMECCMGIICNAWFILSHCSMLGDEWVVILTYVLVFGGF